VIEILSQYAGNLFSKNNVEVLEVLTLVGFSTASLALGVKKQGRMPSEYARSCVKMAMSLHMAR